MKKILHLLFIMVISLNAYSQSGGETIKKANELIADKKYESAFKLLDKFDPDNTKPEIALLKEDIVLNYFVTSMMHQMFALKDLEKDEDIMDYRGKNGSFGMQKFEVDKILDNLIKKYPDDCKLYKGLGDYYYEVSLKYGDEWLKKEKELFKLIEANDLKAIDNNCADYNTYYVMGYINISQKKYREGIPYFLKSIELNKNDGNTYYNLAYAYLYLDKRDSALINAQISLDLYKEKTYKSDAARMMGQIYSELKDTKNAIKSYELAEKIASGNYYNIKPLLDLYVETNNSKVKQTTELFFNLAPANPTIYVDLEDIYIRNKKDDDLISFYNDQLKINSKKPKVEGSLYFYLARIYIERDKKLAKDYFLKAKEIFSKVYKEDHKVFKAIDEGLELLKK